MLIHQHAAVTFVAYEKLLAACGSQPFVPPTKGLDSVKKCFTFMSLADAEALQAAAKLAVFLLSLLIDLTSPQKQSPAADFYEQNQVQTLLGPEAKVEQIDPKDKQLSLADGRTVAYEKLLAAKSAAGNRCDKAHPPAAEFLPADPPEDPICRKSCIAGAISIVDGVVHIDQEK